MPFRVHLDGKWDAAEFAAFFSATNSLYQYYLVNGAPFPWERGPFAYSFPRGPFYLPNLKVERITFASPGFTDLAGIAAAVRELREFIQFLIEHISGSEDRRLGREERRIELARKRVELLRVASELARDYPDRQEINARLLGVNDGGLPDIDALIQVVADGRVVSVESLDSDE